MAADAPVGLVSLARCAELLTAAGDPIDRSALSRYCDKHGLKTGKAGREVLVDFEAVKAHRAGNYTREIMSGRPVGESVQPAPAPSNVTQIPARDDPQRQLKELQLRRELRDEAEAEGRLTQVAEVDAGAAEAIVEMRAAFGEVRGDLAEHLAAELGVPPEKVRVLRAGLKRYDRVGQTRFAERMAKALQDVNRETPDEALARLNELAAHAVRLRSRRNAALTAETA